MKRYERTRTGLSVSSKSARQKESSTDRLSSINSEVLAFTLNLAVTLELKRK